MNVLIMGEFSGRERDAFTAQGHKALSCDWKYDSETPGPHYRGDVRDLLDRSWDLIIAHPDCTYMTNSGVQWLTRTPNNPRPGVLYGRKRWLAMLDAVKFFELFLSGVDCPRIAIENPIMHRHARERLSRTYTQLIQPWQFGEPESKATCLWLKGLPKLTPTKIIPKPLRKQSVFLTPPGPERAHERSRSFRGIAKAMAKQWGQL